MARLKSLAPRLKSGAVSSVRLSDRQAVVAAPPAPSTSASQVWKAWYKTRRWKALRLKVLVRDNYVCQRTGVICSGAYPAPDSAVVNHRKPHRGSEKLFWDEDNLETVSKAVHDRDIQREEQASLHHRGVWD